MSDKRMLILPAEVVKKIDDNRGDTSQAEFISLLIDSHLNPEGHSNGAVAREELEVLRRDLKDIALREKKLATKDELQAFHEDMRKLLKSFIDFFVGYGLESGEKATGLDLKDLTGKLKSLEADMPPLPVEDGGREVKIKWK